MHLFFWRNLFAPRRQKIEVTVETRQTLQVRWLTKESRKFCAECAAETLFLSPKEAVSLLQSGMPSLESLRASGRIHLSETAAGSLICLNSLQAEIEKTPAEQIINLEGREE